ncbi:MAG: ComF family protein [Opitutales bacterium]
MNWGRRFGTLCRDVGELLFPRGCIVTGEAIETEDGVALAAGPPAALTGASLVLGGAHDFRYLSVEALTQLAWVRQPWCPSCGQPHTGELTGEDRLCANCREMHPQPLWEAGRTAFLLRGAGREIIHTLKYHHGDFLEADLRQLVRIPPGYQRFAQGTTLVPVPLHPARLRERGFNQSELVAAALAQGLEHTCVDPLLRRVRWTETQTRRDRKARQANVRGAFALRRGADLSPETIYTVVDDVFTTGATLQACCQVLRKAGARRLRILTLAHG